MRCCKLLNSCSTEPIAESRISHPIRLRIVFMLISICTDDHRQAAGYAACFLRGRPFGQPPFLPASLIFFGSRALQAPRPRAPMIDAAALMTRSSWISALQDGHFMFLILLLYATSVVVYFRNNLIHFFWIRLG